MNRRSILKILVLLGLMLNGGNGRANPLGMTVVSGSAHSVQQGNTLQITTSHNALLQWKSFNIASGETTIFKQPSVSSIVFNNIKDANPSTIFGSLRANGIVVLENQAGFYFGPTAFVKAGGLVVTTSAVNPWASSGGAGWSFDGPPTAAPIVNYGHLETSSGGSLYLIGNQIDNEGTITAPGGKAALIAGQEVLLSDCPDGLGLSAPVKLPEGSVDNNGNIVADAGQVLIQAQTVNNSGVIQANSVREKNGVVELYASDSVQLSASSDIQANGYGSGTSPGGNITIKSGGTFSDSAGSGITATGGANGGNGGKVEVSAPEILSLNSTINTSAQSGWTEGAFSLDPENIELGTFTSGSTSAGTGGVINANGSSGTVDVDVGSAFANINSGTITLEATGNITLDGNTTWNLSSSTRRTSGTLTLEAGGSIQLGDESLITDPNNWSLTLDAGYDFVGGHGVITGTGGTANNIALSGSASIKTATGSISLLAGNSVTVGTGGIVTGIANDAVISGLGGNINVRAAGGEVNCGNSLVGYNFTTSGYSVNSGLGGISTANGGNVSIQASGNIVSEMPGIAGDDAGTGAFGSLPGSVTLKAGGNVTGHYVVADGIGIITSANAGTPNNNLALSLIKGAWVVDAANNIVLQEVRNPNGVYNSLALPNPFQYRFDYDPTASVLLDAGNGVTITGNNLPRSVGNSGEGLIFPPELTIEAGSGGISLDTSVNLFPSPEGSLVIATTAGGNLSSARNGIQVSISVSDSQYTQWSQSLDFTANDPGNDTLHLNDPNPVLFTVSGSVSNIKLYSPKPVDMYVADNINDSSFSVENLRPTDNTIISAGGAVVDYATFLILTLPTGETPNFNALDLVSEPYINILTGLPTSDGSLGPLIDVPNPNLDAALGNQQANFVYNPAAGGIRYKGVMSLAVEQAFLDMKTPFLDSATIKNIFAQTQLEPSSAVQGYDVAGPGNFLINASTLDLGNGGGIISQGIDGHPALVPYTPRGANIDISVSGDISMIASTIESEYGGDINVVTGGTLDVGSLLFPSINGTHPLGIVSLWGGNINVIADGDVNIDGSRIAAYDGGNVFVESLDGNVNAGKGGAGSVVVSKPYVTAQGEVADAQDQIPGSGILATSFPELVFGESSGHVGDITVETPNGDIVASRGGIAQLALGTVAQNDATVTLTAGSKDSDGKVTSLGNVEAAGSGIVGGQVNISATGNINGLVVASVGANVTALQNVSATVLSQGNATVSAGGTVSGTVVGVGSVSVSGATDVAAAFGGGGVSASGSLGGAAVAAGPSGSNSSAAASTTQQGTAATQPTTNTELASNSDDVDQRKKKKNSKLKEYVGRVTVLLPN